MGEHASASPPHGAICKPGALEHQASGRPKSPQTLVRAGSSADAPGTPPAIAPNPAPCCSPRAAHAAVAFGLGASGGGGEAPGRLPTLVPLQGSSAPRVLLGCRGPACLPSCSGAAAGDSNGGSGLQVRPLVLSADPRLTRA
jgi:hypothetical protein